MRNLRKRIFICVYVILFLVCAKRAFTYIYNEILISKYNDHDYSGDVDPLLFCNVIQPYLAHYNMGNIHYQNGDYQAAIDEYKNALEADPGHDEECSVRINLALAIIGTLGEDYVSEENVETSIATLTEARNVLIEEKCATDSGNGHSETAETLKKEIDDLIDQLKNTQTENPEQNNDPNNKPNEDEEDDDDYEQNIKEQLQQQQMDSYEERMQNLDYYDEFDNEMNFDANGRVW